LEALITAFAVPPAFSPSSSTASLVIEAVIIENAELHVEDKKMPTAGPAPELISLEPGKILDLIGAKQTQYYALWAVYTAVQFSAATYGVGRTLSWPVALAVLFGVWTFNFGHLGFVLQCVKQLNHLQRLLLLSISAERSAYHTEVEKFYRSISESTFFWKLRHAPSENRSYFWNSTVHILIDVCASLALMLRAGVPVPG
jgi:hypothetical protein